MTDPTQTGQPSEEELRAYLEQLRAADPAEVLVQAYRMLGTGAEVKLGRADARVLIDAMSGMVQAVEKQVDADLVRQMRDGVGQLQMAQVQAERDAGGQAASGQQGSGQQPEQQEASSGRQPGGQGGQPGTAGRQPPGGQGGQGGGQPGGQGDQGGRMVDRLWVPGRDPRPR